MEIVKNRPAEDGEKFAPTRQLHRPSATTFWFIQSIDGCWLTFIVYVPPVTASQSQGSQNLESSYSIVSSYRRMQVGVWTGLVYYYRVYRGDHIVQVNCPRCTPIKRTLLPRVWSVLHCTPSPGLRDSANERGNVRAHPSVPVHHPSRTEGQSTRKSYCTSPLVRLLNNHAGPSKTVLSSYFHLDFTTGAIRLR